MRPDFSTRGRSPSPRWGNVLLGLGLAFCRMVGVVGVDGMVGPPRGPRISSKGTGHRAVDAVGRWRSRARGCSPTSARLAHAPAAVLSDLAAQLPGDARYSSVAVAYDTAVRLDLAVIARRPEAYDRVLETLARSAEIEQVLPGGETRSDEVNGRVRAAFKAPR